MKFFIFLILFSIGCAEPQMKLVPEKPVSLSWENTDKPHPERAAWSKTLLEEISAKSDALSAASDVQSFCPNFSKLDKETKIKTLAEIMVGMARYESGFNPESDYRECSTKSCRYRSGCFTHPTYGFCMKGNPKIDGGVVTSRGLLQMSISSSNNYGCGLKESLELHDPIKNLKCATLILEKQIKRSGKITGEPQYWAVIRASRKPKEDGTPSHHIVDIKNRVLKYVPTCR